MEDESVILDVVRRAAAEADQPPIARRAPSPDVPLVCASAGRTVHMRWCGALVAAAGGAVLFIAASVAPNGNGVATHEKLGLPPCGFLLMSGLPCPTCGMTTSFSWMMHGHPLRSLASQPLGALLCLGTMAAVMVGIWMAATGRRLVFDWVRFSPAGLMFTLAAVFFLAWGAKIAYGLMTGELPYHR